MSLGDGEVLGYHLRLVLGVITYLSLGDVLGEVLRFIDGFVSHVCLVKSMVVCLGEVLRHELGLGDVGGVVVGEVVGLVLRHVLDVGLVH